MAYLITWKYKIHPENREKFEIEYGADGSWHKLFSKSANYLCSTLYQDDNERDVYFLVDKWISKNSYDNFLEENRTTYEQLSESFNYLYKEEKKTGTSETDR